MLTLLLVIGIIMFALWALGLITRRTFGGFLHIALVIAVILIILWLIFAIFLADEDRVPRQPVGI